MSNVAPPLRSLYLQQFGGRRTVSLPAPAIINLSET